MEALECLLIGAKWCHQNLLSILMVENLIYNGEGYALYAKNNGEIKFANGDIILRGKSTAMELNASGTNPIDISNTQITVMSMML